MQRLHESNGVDLYYHILIDDVVRGKRKETPA